MYTMEYRETLTMWKSAGHKGLSLHVAAGLKINGKAIFENALDWSLAGKLPVYVQMVKDTRAATGKAPKYIRFSYVNGDIHIVDKNGAIIV